MKLVCEVADIKFVFLIKFEGITRILLVFVEVIVSLVYPPSFDRGENFC